MVHDPWGDRFDRDEIRAWIRSMWDKTAGQAIGRAARKLIRPEGRRAPPREVFRVQLEECRAEWRRRHSKFR